MAGTSKINPRDFSLLSDTVAKEQTQKLYKRDWLQFVEFSGLTEDSIPDENMFTNFLKFRRTTGKLCGNSIQTLLSTLSTMTLHFYNFKIDKVSYELLYIVKKTLPGGRGQTRG